jgi:hypothetical protein
MHHYMREFAVARNLARTKQAGYSDAWFVVPLVVIAIILVLLRRAHTISVQYGFKFWSAETLHEMMIYFKIGGVIAGLAIVRAIHQAYRDRDDDKMED